ncbi:MAG: TRAP transporter small permease subunit [Alphaproteobacteria bacterium]|nr:MAG: TRAP transporter small permease subunit [Alphaproteobacteria bacterium]
MRRALDRLYAAALWLAALAILGIVAVVCAQVALNALARIGGPALSFTIPSYADFAGFLLAGASFLALGPTLIAGGHIRVTLVLAHLPERLAWIAELLTLALGLVLALTATRFMAGLALESWQFGDRSPGIVPVPLWLPQSVCVLGLAILAVAFADLAVQALARRRRVVPDASAAPATPPEESR